MKPGILQPTFLENTCFKIIGLGGVGGIVAKYTSMFLASVGRNARLVLVDGDSFELSNANRMFFGKYGNKAEVICEELLARFADSKLSLVPIKKFITSRNIGRSICNNDVVLLAVDNHATRKLVNDHCLKLRNVCLISGGNDGVGKDSTGQLRRGTYGSVQIYRRKNGKDELPPLTWQHPEIEQPADRLPTERHCTDLITSVPQILFANLMVASVMLNTLWLYLCGALHYGELAFDIAEGLMRPLRFQNEPKNHGRKEKMTG